MALKKLETLATKTLFKNPYWEYRLDEYSLPDGTAGEYHYVHSHGASLVVPVHEDGALVLVKQFRYLWKKESIEFSCGGVKNADYLGSAKNELAEEARLSATEWAKVAEFNPFNGATDEVCKVYLATGLSSASRARDASEEFEIIKMSVGEFEEVVNRGEIWDGMTLAAWMLSKQHVLNYLKRVGR